MALVSRWFVESNISDANVSAGRWQSESVHDTFDAANEAAVALVAHGKTKADVRVVGGMQFEDSDEIAPAEDKPAE